MKVVEKMIYKNVRGKVVRLTDHFGNNRYMLFDSAGNYLRDISSVFAVKDMKELFPHLAN